MFKECPKCKQKMVKLSLDQALDERWACTNTDCKYVEQIHHLADFDKLQAQDDKK